MSLYSMVCPPNRGAGMLFATIGLDFRSVPRLRDIWINRDLTEVTVFTRTGGGNRSEYEVRNAALRSHAGFLRDSDWEKDATYALWVYAADPEKAAVIRRDLGERSAQDQETVMGVITKDASAKWEEVMAGLSPDASHEF